MRVPNDTRHGRRLQISELRDDGLSMPTYSEEIGWNQPETQFPQTDNAASEPFRLLWSTGLDIVYPKLGADENAAQWLLRKLLRHSESVLIPIYGEAGELLVDICEKLGSDVITAEQARGAVFEQEELMAELRRRRPSVLIMAHGDLTTGQLQPLDKLGRTCRELDILFLVDVSATTGEVPILADEWHIDALLTGLGKNTAFPGSMLPIAFNDQIKARIRSGKPERGDGKSAPENYIQE